MSNEEIGEGNIVWGVAHREETGEGEQTNKQTNKQTAANFISDVYCTYVNDLSCTIYITILQQSLENNTSS